MKIQTFPKGIKLNKKRDDYIKELRQMRYPITSIAKMLNISRTAVSDVWAKRLKAQMWKCSRCGRWTKNELLNCASCKLEKDNN